jgi:hypothetical protein
MPLDLATNFPNLNDILCGEDDSSYEYRAISVFDAWLGPSRYHELDCNSATSQERDRRLDGFSSRLLSVTQVLRLELGDQADGSPVVALPFESQLEAQGYARQASPDTSGSDFFKLLFPDWRCVYLEAWDFTNVFYLRDLEPLDEIHQLAKDSGLFVLEKDW